MITTGMKLRFYPFLSFVLMSLLAFYGCEKKASEEAEPAAITPESAKYGEINLQQTRLAEIPEDYDKWGNISFSADGRRVLYIARKKGRQFIAVATAEGGKSGPAYEGISFFVKSPDGRRFAFGGTTGRGKRLVVDNKELRDLFHEEVAPASFSPDGRFVACEVGGLNEKKWFIAVSDGEKVFYRSRVYPDTWRQPVFSPDGRLLVYELGDNKMKEGNKRSTIFFLDVSARKIIKEWLYTDQQIGSFSFSSDSSRVIYDIDREAQSVLVLYDFALNKERTAKIADTRTGKFVLSQGGTHILYSASRKGKQYLVISPWEAPEQGKEIGPYEAIASPSFGPDSKTPIYRAMKKGAWRRVVGEREGRAYEDIGDEPPVFSPDGAMMAYPAMKYSSGGQRDRGTKTGKWVMVVSPTERPDVVKEGPVYDMVVTPVFSPDGRRIAYRARKGPMEKARRFIVIADAETGTVIKEGRAGDEIWPPVWSPDGKAAAYGARQGRELWWRVEEVE